MMTSSKQRDKFPNVWFTYIHIKQNIIVKRIMKVEPIRDMHFCLNLIITSLYIYKFGSSHNQHNFHFLHLTIFCLLFKRSIENEENNLL